MAWTKDISELHSDLHSIGDKDKVIMHLLLRGYWL